MGKTAESARGRWREILGGAVGVDEAFLSGKHGPCPLCGGSDRFRFDDKEGRGTYYCNNCGAGDGFILAQKFLGSDFDSVVEIVDKFLLIEPQVRGNGKKSERSETQLRNALNAVWRTNRDDEPLYWYLSDRGIPNQVIDLLSVDVRGSSGIPYYSGVVPPSQKEMRPAMLATIRNHDGKPVSIHRTYFSKTSGWREKKIMTPCVKIDRPFIQVVGDWNGTCEDLIVGEGIETALAGLMYAMNNLDVEETASVRATISANWMKNSDHYFSIPGIKRVFICADNDDNFVGQEAALSMARVACRYADTYVLLPRSVGADMLDAVNMTSEVVVIRGQPE